MQGLQSAGTLPCISGASYLPYLTHIPVCLARRRYNGPAVHHVLPPLKPGGPPVMPRAEAWCGDTMVACADRVLVSFGNRFFHTEGLLIPQRLKVPEDACMSPHTHTLANSQTELAPLAWPYAPSPRAG